MADAQQPPPAPEADDPAASPQPEEEPNRNVQPVDAEQPPRLPFPVVGIGASAGGLEAFTEFFKAMRPDSGMAFVLVQHLPPDRESLVADILARHTKMPVAQVEDGMAVEPDHVYVIRPGHTLTIRDGRLHLGQPLHSRGNNRPVDDFFKSLAEEQRERAICAIFSGMGSNGTAGAQGVKAVGGLCVAQDPESAQFPSMPRHLIDAGYADYILRPADVPDVLLAYAGHPYARGGREERGRLPARDQQHLREILAILRTRTRQDFTGYKKPTVYRRVQRRMGLNRVDKLGEYAKLLRQSPTEVTGLADDLLIHVTGFFRDREAWDALQKRVIVPLVAGREPDAAVRCWVTACSSGEEAYTLAMLLIEEAERAGKHLDIKVFATDMAERSLQNARQGIYPGGIEAEIAPERLDRFFQREDAVYRVRQELREAVVFAPQNVLQDPPFSRLDIVSCRNLLIYLEPDVQQRVLHLLHFGLREGGTLFLGTSETTAGNEDLYETIDKKARIFRRLGPTRHGAVVFPLPHAMAATGVKRKNGGGGGGGGDDDDEGGGGARSAFEVRAAAGRRPSLWQMTTLSLLEHHTPAAVTIDRDGRIVYFHGNTEPFLTHPRGEPTRELLSMARESVRGAVRTAVQRARRNNRAETVLDGWLAVEADRRVRLAVTASPLDPRVAPDHVVVSFQERGEAEPGQVDGNGVATGDGGGPNGRAGDDELGRVRDELQSTIEELQTSNEELKASHEEVVSINEELQSTNEELETSREEMQSLNEELVTVNAQLLSKMDELQATTNDLSSLLASTDIGVLFLDPRFRIRRFTPPVRDLLELIASDVGRPLSDLARKFTDPDLLPDAAGVLERLAPSEREVAAADGRWYLRRVTPYRTADNRIDGVVVTFVDITARRAAEDGLRQGEARFRLLVKASAQVLYHMSPDWAEMRSIEGGGFLADADRPSRGWLQAYVPPEDRGRVMAAVREAVRTKGVFDLEHRVRRVDGTTGWMSSRAIPVLDDAGAIVEWFGAAADVTERRQADEALRRSEQRIRQLFELMPAGVYTTSASGRITFFNRHAAGLWGREPARAGEGEGEGERFCGSLRMRTPDGAPLPKDQSPVAVALREGRPVRGLEVVIERPDGARLSVSANVDLLHDDAGRLIGAINVFEDVTGRRRADAALRESEARFRTATAAAAMGFWEWDVARDVTTWDPQHNRIVGVPTDEAHGTRARFEATLHPDDRARTAAALEAAIEHRADYTAEYRVVHPDGTVHWVACYGRPFVDAAGRVTRMIGGVQDVTHRKAIEVERADLLQRERAARATAEAANRMKDEFLATLSHELRTPLSAILLWSKMLRGRSGAAVDPADRDEGLAAIENSAEAQKALIDDLLDSSRITSGKLRLQLREVELAPLVADAVDAIEPTAEAKGVEVATDLGPAVGIVRADPDRLRQVVWNLLTNAVKFTPAGGRVDVRLSRHDAEVEVRVTDTGQGMDAEFLPLVFDRFRQAEAVSTRTHGGLGLGLAICKQLVELHGGTIRAESAGPGRGAAFVVRLPLPKVRRKPTGRKPPRNPAGDGDDGERAGGSEAPPLAGARVLLVEDDAETRGGLAVLLRRAGAVVTAVDSAAAALAALDAAAGALDVIVSDIGLPGGDGHGLIREVRRRETAAAAGSDAPTPIPAVALTAFARDEDRQRAIDAGFQQHVGKPVEPEQLLATLRAVLKDRGEEGRPAT